MTYWNIQLKHIFGLSRCKTDIELYPRKDEDRRSDVNKDLGLKAKAKAKDSDPKAKAKAKDFSHKAKAKAKDSDPKAKDKAKDLGPKAKAEDSRYQGPIFHRSSPYIFVHR